MVILENHQNEGIGKSLARYICTMNTQQGYKNQVFANFEPFGQILDILIKSWSKYAFLKHVRVSGLIGNSKQCATRQRNSNKCKNGFSTVGPDILTTSDIKEGQKSKS